MRLQLDRDGAELFPGLCKGTVIDELDQLMPSTTRGSHRIFDHHTLASWLNDGALPDLVEKFIGSTARPVRAILFDKNVGSNWALAWHQDRTIAVKKRVEQLGFEHWTVKSGAHHVEPPFSFIEAMLTVRIHIDPVSASNAPLLIARGSHRLGRIIESDVASIVERCGTVTCLADRGDVWLYRTAILHASEASCSGSNRRVLQVDFSSEDLPAGMKWLGIKAAS